MKRISCFLVGSALIATTALSSVASAEVVREAGQAPVIATIESVQAIESAPGLTFEITAIDTSYDYVFDRAPAQVGTFFVDTAGAKPVEDDITFAVLTGRSLVHAPAHYLLC